MRKLLSKPGLGSRMEAFGSSGAEICHLGFKAAPLLGLSLFNISKEFLQISWGIFLDNNKYMEKSQR